MAKNKTGLPTGTYVTRSTYQKLCEENKKLKSEIMTLVTKPLSEDAEKINDKYMKIFSDKKKLDEYFYILKTLKLSV